jgi:hypothetical protein
MHTKVIDQIRTQVWLTEIRSLSGLQTIHALAARFDPRSTWKDGEGIPHQSKWYRYDSGEAVPSDRLTGEVVAALPTLSFDIHHPTWTLLRKPAPSQKTIERLVDKMPPLWRQILKTLNSDTFDFRRIDLELVTKYRLTTMGYLDAFLLFELARRNALSERGAKAENLTFIILALPLIYIDDPLWIFQNAFQKKATLQAVVRSLWLSGEHFGFICFPKDRLVQAMAMQRVLLLRHTHNRPRALNSQEKKVRYLAKCLGDNPDERYSIATSAFVKERPHFTQIRLLFWGHDPHAQPNWQWAWNWLKQDPVFSHFSECLKRPKKLTD